MAHTRKSKVSKVNIFFRVVVLLIEIGFLGVVFFCLFGNPIPVTPSEIPEQPIATATPEIPEVSIQEPETTTVPVVTPEPTVEEPVEEPVEESPEKLSLHQINVACANAYLLQYGDINIFIDGGLHSALPTVKRYLEEQGVTHLDAYIGTHWHGDHTDNAAELMSLYGDSDTVLYGPGTNVDGLVKMLRGRTYKKSGTARLSSDVNYVQFKEGDVLRFGEMELICVGPYVLQQNGSNNYDSMNFVIRYGDFKAFMTADYVHSKQVMESYGDLIANVDVLQMPHHGLDPIYISSSALKLANPKVILVPANSSGPSAKMIKDCGIDCVKYDNKSGNVVVTTYGEGFEIQTSK